MLFNSPEFIFAFLPLVVIGFYALSGQNLRLSARLWLVLTSLFFYGYWKAIYLPVLLTSACINYGIGSWLGRRGFVHPTGRKALLLFGLGGNLLLLGYFKYSNFLLGSAFDFFGMPFEPLPIILPLAISFFTFQKIGYLVDSYYRKTEGYSFVNYLLFVSFFPQLIAGPIVHHKEIVSQFESPTTYRLDWRNFAKGIVIFLLGLGKKTILADTVAVWATNGFDHLPAPSCLQAWAAALAYTMQIYFDFSGYTDMAIGAALLFNIRLPQNFNSPYHAGHIRDFWRRWHITLSRFLRDYVYIPLGGNRSGDFRSAINMIFTFFIGGIWHGAAWTFIFWGLYHGTGIVVHLFWEKRGWSLPQWMGRFMTFLFLLVGWVFFRAKGAEQALHMLKAMAGMGVSTGSIRALGADPSNTIGIATTLQILIAAVLIAFFGENTQTLQARLRPSWKTALAFSMVAIFSFVCGHHSSEFLYFNF
jgi:alginate O-acetyltransferase complex protein AlgI